MGASKQSGSELEKLIAGMYAVVKGARDSSITIDPQAGIAHATDLEVDVVCASPSLSVFGTKLLKVDAKTLHAVLSKLRGELSVVPSDSSIEFKAGHTRVKVPLYKANPIVNPPVDFNLSFPSDALIPMLSAALGVATSTVYTGVLMAAEGKRLVVAATDGVRLLEASAELPEEFNASVLVSSHAARSIVALNPKHSTIGMSMDDNSIRFKVGDYTVAARRTTAKFPEYKKIMTDKFNTRYAVKPKDFQDSLERIGVVITDVQTNVTMQFHGEELKLSLPGDAATDALNVECLSHTPFDAVDESIAFKYGFLRDLFDVFQDRERVEIKLNGPSSPAEFSVEGVRVIMAPVRKVDDTIEPNNEEGK